MCILSGVLTKCPKYKLNSLYSILTGENSKASQHFTPSGIFIQRSITSNHSLVGLFESRPEQVQSSAWPRSSGAPLCRVLGTPLFTSPPSQLIFCVNSSLPSNPKFQILSNETATFCTSLQKGPQIEMWVNVKFTSYVFLLSRITALYSLLYNAREQLPHIFCAVLQFVIGV